MIQKRYELAKQQYAEKKIDTDQALETLKTIPISLHCWQGDDVGGFEVEDSRLAGGGIQATGDYPGKARNLKELRADLEKAFSLIPGQHRLNLHACYLDNQGKYVDRNQVQSEHFLSWIDWARENRLGMDFNPTFFSHKNAEDGFTLSHWDKNIRDFWIEHGKACREIGARMGQELGSPAVVNFWIPDGYKDFPADRKGPRERLCEALDAIFDKDLGVLDAVESKLFGIGTECYTVGSHEFYMGYAITRKKLLCLDSGHFHPTESIADKISSVLPFVPGLLLHVSRPMRWDSDHVVLLDDELRAITRELVNGACLNKTHIGLDFFDASINRIAAWVLGARNLLKGLLLALLEPNDALKRFELDKDYTSRLALMEEFKTMPFGPVWDYYCNQSNVPEEGKWMQVIKEYEDTILSGRH